MDEWNELDQSAEANLSSEDLREFFKFKEKLRREGVSWTDAYDDLKGLIWASIEGDELQDFDDEV